jgi:hypothetical protein
LNDGPSVLFPLDSITHPILTRGTWLALHLKVKLLLKYGRDWSVNATDPNGRTALWKVCRVLAG